MLSLIISLLIGLHTFMYCTMDKFPLNQYLIAVIEIINDQLGKITSCHHPVWMVYYWTVLLQGLLA